MVLVGTRLAFNRIVVVRYRMHFEARGLAANTINQQLAAVRQLAYDAADAGLLSPELVAGIGSVNGVKQLGFRSGNWLSLDHSPEILSHALGEGLGAKRDYAMLAMLLGCGLRRSELADLDIDEVQTREGHWAIVGLIGKGGRIRTVPIPQWVKQALDLWISAAGITGGRVFRAVSKRASGGELDQIQFLLGHVWVQTTERYLGCKQNLGHPVNDRFTLGIGSTAPS